MAELGRRRASFLSMLSVLSAIAFPPDGNESKKSKSAFFARRKESLAASVAGARPADDRLTFG
jgi:hypothetical protein